VPLTPPAQRFLDLLRETFAAAEAPPNSNLPALETALLGRHSEVEELIGLVGGGERTVTLTGAAGSGKTRLAIEVAARLVDDFPDGVYLVDLAPLRDPALVPATIAEVLAAGDADELERRLERKRVLLVLDNFEHLLEARRSWRRSPPRCRSWRSSSRAACRSAYAASVAIASSRSRLSSRPRGPAGRRRRGSRNGSRRGYRSSPDGTTRRHGSGR
jgi:hypothetical protein